MRILRPILRIVLAMYLLVVLLFDLFQDALIYPGHFSQGKAYTAIGPRQDQKLLALQTSVGDRLYAIFGPALDSEGHSLADGASRPILIFFYGGGDCLAGRFDICHDWQKMGANVLAMDFPGYGMSSGQVGEKAFYAAADATYEYARSQTSLGASGIIPVGLSLGTGVAVDLASRKPVGGLILLAPYTSVTEMAGRLYPWLPTSLMIRSHFPSDQKIGLIDAPILIIHGNHDSLIPREMSQRLARLATGAKVTLMFVDSDHVDIFDRANGEILPAMKRMVEQTAERQSQ